MLCPRCSGDEIAITEFPGNEEPSVVIECPCGHEEWITAEELNDAYAMERDIQRAVDPRGAAVWELWAANGSREEIDALVAELYPDDPENAP
jgi:hypothetical protein